MNYFSNSEEHSEKRSCSLGVGDVSGDTFLKLSDWLSGLAIMASIALVHFQNIVGVFLAF